MSPDGARRGGAPAERESAGPGDPRGGVLWHPGHEWLLDDIVRAENCSLYDRQGNRYVDLEAGVWCTSVGHGHPRVVRALVDQATRIAHTGFGYSCPATAEAAAEILSVLGFEGGRCVLLSSGSESVEYAVRAARAVDDRPLFLSMADSYFGAYGSARERRPSEWHAFDWLACGACAETGSCGDRCERFASIPFDRIAGFLFEPGSSSGLVRFPPVALVRSIVGEIRARGGLVLVNEVTTGVGRTGRWFGYEHYGIAPDVVAVGKGIGNGYPVSATAFAAPVAERVAGAAIGYMQSHQNDPLGAAVAREVVRVVRDEGLIERGREIAALLVGGLEGIRARTAAVRDVRSRGLMVAVELAGDADTGLAIQVHHELLRRGYVVARRPGLPVFRLDPALTIPRSDIVGFLAAFEAILSKEAPRRMLD